LIIEGGSAETVGSKYALVISLTEKQTKHSLLGHVKHQGLPVAGVEVRVLSPLSLGTQGPGKLDPAVAQAITGTKGEFSFSLPGANYILEVIPNPTTRFLKERVNDVELFSNTTCNIGLTTGTLLTGTVVTQSGKQIIDGEVVAIGIEPIPYEATSKLTPEGAYALVLPKGKFHIASRHVSQEDAEPNANGIEEAHTITNGTTSFPFVSTQILVVNLVIDGTLEIVLPELVKFQGEVRDVFGQPVSNALVKFAPGVPAEQMLVRELNLCAESKSDAQGSFEIWLEPGNYDLDIIPAPSATHFGMREANVKVDSDTTRSFVLQEGHKLKGEVMFEDEPLSSCLVRVQDVSSTKEFIAKTDNQGQFTLGVPGGNYKMVVVAHPKSAPSVTIDGAQHAGIAPWAKMIVVGGDTQVNVGLLAGTALKGRIRDDSGQARAGLQISVFADSKEKFTAQTSELHLALAHSVTDADGRYSIFLSPGEYLIVVHKDFANATPVEVGTEPVNLDITWHGWCHLKFEISGEDGGKVSRCQMEYYPYGEKPEDDANEQDSATNLPRGYVLTDDEGRCQVTIPQGVYTFKFNPPNSGSYVPKDIRQLSISADISRKVVLSLKRQG